uniref:Acyl-CoA-binding domain-containing protein 6 n=1 Tax=Cebus imitator TaxID=2715852 RepID=A0A2K5QLC7_CEBIM
VASSFLPARATAGNSSGELSSGDNSGGGIKESCCLAELFEKALAHLQGLIQVASREKLLYLYARYKQVKLEIAVLLNQASLILKETWKALGDSSPSQAMQEYIAVVKKVDPGWNPQIPEKKGKEENAGSGGLVISSLFREETIREEDKNIFDYCRGNSIDHITKAIKSKNVDMNVKDEEGRALLHWACDQELVTALLQRRAGINCQGSQGQTALHYASACEFLDIRELLLRSGADPTLRD